MVLMLTIGAARSAGWLPAGLNVVSVPCSGRSTLNCMTRPSAVASGAPNPVGLPLGKGMTAKFFIVKVFPDWPAKSTITSARSAGARKRHLAPAPTSTLLPIGAPAQALGPLAGSSSLTGLLKRPPSEPICQIAGPGRAVLVHVDALLVEHLHDQEARVAGVDDPEAIAARLDLHGRPALAVDRDDVAEELRDPEGMLVRVGRRSVQVGGVVRVGEVELAVGVELTVLNHQLGLLRARRKRDRVARQARVPAIADEVEARQAGVDVEPHDPQRVVVKPERRRLLLVRVVVGVADEGPSLSGRTRASTRRPGARRTARGPRCREGERPRESGRRTAACRGRQWRTVDAVVGRRRPQGICPVDRLIDGQQLLQMRVGEAVGVDRRRGDTLLGLRSFAPARRPRRR